ncbi:MAG: hypothetical protein HUJ30_08220 [Gammaproteobacteria bacterium]|nr:hypothetical protein [Gammaproteobacteria bacterium]
MPWPSVGKLLLNGYRETPESAVNRTPMEKGPPKQAKVKSRRMVPRAVRYRMTPAERDTWETWFTGAECNFGSGWFDWINPFKGITTQARIVNGEYQFTAASAGEGAPLEWELSITLESWE